MQCHREELGDSIQFSFEGCLFLFEILSFFINMNSDFHWYVRFLRMACLFMSVHY